MSLFGFSSKSKLSKVATDNVANYRIQRNAKVKQLLSEVCRFVKTRVIEASQRGELECVYSFNNSTFDDLILTNDECDNILKTITSYLGLEGVKFDVKTIANTMTGYFDHMISMNWSDPDTIVNVIEKNIQKKN